MLHITKDRRLALGRDAAQQGGQRAHMRFKGPRVSGEAISLASKLTESPTEAALPLCLTDLSLLSTGREGLQWAEKDAFIRRLLRKKSKNLMAKKKKKSRHS